MTLKDVIEKWTPQSWRRMAIAGTLAVSGVAGAQTTLEPVDPPDLYSSGPGYSGVAVVYDGSDRYVHASWDNNYASDFFTEDLEIGKTGDQDIGGSDSIIDQASAGMDVYHLKDNGNIFRTDADDLELMPLSETQIGDNSTFNNYDHLAAVQIGTGDYLILVEKDGTDPHYKIWKVDDPGKGWEGSAISFSGNPDFYPISDSFGAGAYLASSGSEASQSISDIILGLSWLDKIAFFKSGQYLSSRDCNINDFGIEEIQDVAFNPTYESGSNQNRAEVYVVTESSSVGTVARLAIDNEGTYENLPIYVNPVATITGDTEGLESEQPNPQISITLSRHPNDKSDTLSTVPPVPEVPITVEYSIGGTATRGVGQDYTIDGE